MGDHTCNVCRTHSARDLQAWIRLRLPAEPKQLAATTDVDWAETRHVSRHRQTCRQNCVFFFSQCKHIVYVQLCVHLRSVAKAQLLLSVLKYQTLANPNGYSGWRSRVPRQGWGLGLSQPIKGNCCTTALLSADTVLQDFVASCSTVLLAVTECCMTALLQQKSEIVQDDSSKTGTFLLRHISVCIVTSQGHQQYSFIFTFAGSWTKDVITINPVSNTSGICTTSECCSDAPFLCNLC